MWNESWKYRCGFVCGSWCGGTVRSTNDGAIQGAVSGAVGSVDTTKGRKRQHKSELVWFGLKKNKITHISSLFDNMSTEITHISLSFPTVLAHIASELQCVPHRRQRRPRCSDNGRSGTIVSVRSLVWKNKEEWTWFKAFTSITTFFPHRSKRLITQTKTRIPQHTRAQGSVPKAGPHLQVAAHLAVRHGEANRSRKSWWQCSDHSRCIPETNQAVRPIMARGRILMTFGLESASAMPILNFTRENVNLLTRRHRKNQTLNFSHRLFFHIVFHVRTGMTWSPGTAKNRKTSWKLIRTGMDRYERE
jgi:hypothetical protein